MRCRADRICARCGAAHQRHQYCSTECADAARYERERAGKVCGCGNPLSKGRHKYCSAACEKAAKAERDRKRHVPVERPAPLPYAERRRLERARAAEKAGKAYRTADDIQADRAERLLLLTQQRLVRRLVGRQARSAVRRIAAVRKAELKAASHVCVIRSAITTEWQGRYRDPAHRAKELTRLRAKKLRRKHGKEMADDGTVTLADLEGGCECLYCTAELTPFNRTADHMDPITSGGVHSASNIAPCCRRCNSSKGSKSFVAWVATLGAVHRERAMAFYMAKRERRQAA